MSANISCPIQYQLRLPEGLRERIKAHASVRKRSMNTEIVHALEEAFPEPVADEMAVLRAENAQLRAELASLKGGRGGG